MNAKGIEVDQHPTDLGPAQDGDTILAVRKGRRGRATLRFPTDANMGAVLAELALMRERLDVLESDQLAGAPIATREEMRSLAGPDGTTVSFLRYFGWSDEPTVEARQLDDSLVEVAAYYADEAVLPVRREAGYCWYAQLASAGYPDRIEVRRDEGESHDATNYFAPQPGTIGAYVVGVSKRKLAPDLGGHIIELIYND